jgi:phosphoribosyl 1,2-cyclic phosphodiesterase
MKFCVLGSGSKGNATYLESGETSILIDAGMSGVELEKRLSAIGVELSAIDAILVTHEHNDHVQGVGRSRSTPIRQHFPGLRKLLKNFFPITNLKLEPLFIAAI